MASPVYNSTEGDSRGATMEGLDFLAPDLTATISAGLIDGRAVAAATATLTAAGSNFRGFLVSEDGDGTYTVTLGTDALATAVLAAAEALTLDVPAGGVGIATGAVNNTTTVTLLSMEQRGKLPKVSVLG
jgi:hypothetical protein